MSCVNAKKIKRVYRSGLRGRAGLEACKIQKSLVMAAGKKIKGLSGGSISNARNFFYYYYLNMLNLIVVFAIKYWLKFPCSMFLIIFVCHYYVCVYSVLFLSHL